MAQNRSQTFVTVRVACVLTTILAMVIGAQSPARADGTWNVFHTGSSGLTGDVITSLACDSLDNVWVGTDGRGVVMYNGIEWIAYRGGGEQLQSIVSAITVMPHGEIYIGYNGSGGVGEIIKKKYAVHTKSEVTLPSNNIQHLVADGKNNMWIGTPHGLGTRSHDGAWSIVEDVDLPSKKIAALATDAKGRVWMGYDNVAGLSCYDGHSIQHYDHDHSNFPDTKVIDVMCGHDGAIWAGTETSGLVKFKNNAVTIYSLQNSGVPNNKVYGVAMDRAGRVWVGTAGGAGMFDGERWTMFTSENSPLPSNQVFAVVVDRRGRAWFGTQDGLAVYTPRVGEE